MPFSQFVLCNVAISNPKFRISATIINFTFSYERYILMDFGIATNDQAVEVLIDESKIDI